MTNFISGRVRLARNLADVPFPSRMTKEQAENVISSVWEALSASALKDSLRLIRLDKEQTHFISSLAEKHLVSPDFLKGNLPRAVILSKDEKISIMLNEEDHIRIQVFSDTESLSEAYETADKIDTLLSEKLNIAFHEKFGFLTACPTNAGTGMRASFMLHLPALTMTNSISSVLSWATKLSLTIRGIYGEGSKAKGSFYQLSNQITLGTTEKDIINRLNVAAKELIEKEKMVRDALFENNPIALTDRCMRSYGILKNAYTLSSEEAFSLASDVMLAINAKLISDISVKEVSEAIFETLPSSMILKNEALEKDAPSRDVARAAYLREKLSK